jgi:hypothetical protein
LAWVVGLGILAVGLALAACGPAPTALQVATSHPYSFEAAQYVGIKLSDFPAHYRSSPAAPQTSSSDASQTLAEYRCEKIEPAVGPSPISAQTPDFTDPSKTTEVHETTAVFKTAASASSHLQLELNSRYPTCKAAVFKAALVKNASPGEHVGFVSVHLFRLPASNDDDGVEVTGIATLTLADGTSTVATSDLVVLQRGRFVSELSLDTEGENPSALLGQLTTDLSERLAQVVPAATTSGPG